MHRASLRQRLGCKVNRVACPGLAAILWFCYHIIVIELCVVLFFVVDSCHATLKLEIWLQGADADNIIPEQVFLRGTVRTLSHEQMVQLQQRIEEVVSSVAAAYRCNGTVDWLLDEHPYYPPTVNDPAAAAFAQQVAAELLGSANVSPCPGCGWQGSQRILAPPYCHPKTRSAAVSCGRACALSTS